MHLSTDITFHSRQCGFFEAGILFSTALSLATMSTELKLDMSNIGMQLGGEVVHPAVISACSLESRDVILVSPRQYGNLL